MVRVYVSRKLGSGRVYQRYLEYSTKAQAVKNAKALRKDGFGARVFKEGGEWVVFATRDRLSGGK